MSAQGSSTSATAPPPSSHSVNDLLGLGAADVSRPPPTTQSVGALDDLFGDFASHGGGGSALTQHSASTTVSLRRMPMEPLFLVYFSQAAFTGGDDKKSKDAILALFGTGGQSGIVTHAPMAAQPPMMMNGNYSKCEHSALYC